MLVIGHVNPCVTQRVNSNPKSLRALGAVAGSQSISSSNSHPWSTSRAVSAATSSGSASLSEVVLTASCVTTTRSSPRNSASKSAKFRSENSSTSTAYNARRPFPETPLGNAAVKIARNGCKCVGSATITTASSILVDGHRHRTLRLDCSTAQKSGVACKNRNTHLIRCAKSDVVRTNLWSREG